VKNVSFNWWVDLIPLTPERITRKLCEELCQYVERHAIGEDRIPDQPEEFKLLFTPISRSPTVTTIADNDEDEIPLSTLHLSGVY
jgi:hypothetical protein